MKKRKSSIEWKENAQLEVVTVTKKYGFKLAKWTICLSLISSVIIYNIPYLYLLTYFVSTLKTQNIVITLPSITMNVMLIIFLVIAILSYIACIVMGILSIIYGKRGIMHHVNTTRTLKIGISSIVLSSVFLITMVLYLLLYVLI